MITDLVWGKAATRRRGEGILWHWIEGGSDSPKQPHLRENGFGDNKSIYHSVPQSISSEVPRGVPWGRYTPGVSQTQGLLKLTKTMYSGLAAGPELQYM